MRHLRVIMRRLPRYDTTLIRYAVDTPRHAIRHYTLTFRQRRVHGAVADDITLQYAIRE